MNAQWDALVADVTAALHDRDRLAAELARVTHERDAARAERDTARAEWARVTAERDALVKERDLAETFILRGIPLEMYLHDLDVLRITGGLVS